jgi:hypothetical protein
LTVPWWIGFWFFGRRQISPCESGISQCIRAPAFCHRAAAEAKVDRKSHYNWLESDKDYPARFAEAKAIAQQKHWDGSLPARHFAQHSMRTKPRFAAAIAIAAGTLAGQTAETVGPFCSLKQA